mmetsp:Transcript_54694/g.150713  ORF Transcript_54694/g.150713 Transcript_54694/m.150713 type:complete len:95 (+) Transcript_54694:509-793(+)
MGENDDAGDVSDVSDEETMSGTIAGGDENAASAAAAAEELSKGASLSTDEGRPSEALQSGQRKSLFGRALKSVSDSRKKSVRMAVSVKGDFKGV